MTDDINDGPRDGATFDPSRDGNRLNRQARDVYRAMGDWQWHTLYALSLKTGHPEASISARLRDFRKKRFGSHLIDKRYAGNGQWEYRYAGRKEKQS